MIAAIDLSSVTDGVASVVAEMLPSASSVIVAALGLLAVRFGGPWLVGLFRSMTGDDSPDPNDPNDIRNYDQSGDVDREVYGYAPGDDPWDRLNADEVEAGLEEGWLVMRDGCVRYADDDEDD